MLEQKFEKSHFTRVDSDIIDRLIVKEDAKKSDLTDDERDNLSQTFRSQMPKIDKTDFTVSVEAMGETNQPVLITQSGKTVTLSTSKNLLEYGLKGGTKTLDLFTNSDSIIASNNDLTWYVESKPDWVEINVDVQKKKGIFEKGFKAVKGVVAGKVAASEASDVKTSGVNIQVMPLIKADKEFSTGRKGEIIFASQDKRYKVMVVQQK